SLIDIHGGSAIWSIRVVRGCGENCRKHTFPVHVGHTEEAEAVHHHLMSTYYQRQIQCFHGRLQNVLTKVFAHSTDGVVLESEKSTHGISPQQIAREFISGGIDEWFFYLEYVVETLQFRRDSSMHTENARACNTRKRKVRERLVEHVEHV
ncbi:hypothetical protein PFISCL1PPCAC_9116, partial [Pristionchus fissidentatus]